jgi:hypothetical protein
MHETDSTMMKENLGFFPPLLNSFSFGHSLLKLPRAQPIQVQQANYTLTKRTWGGIREERMENGSYHGPWSAAALFPFVLL